MHAQILLVVLLACFVGNTNAADPVGTFNLYLVRHSEKQDGDGSDPALSDAGMYRSEQLASWFQDKDIKQVWSSDYRRSRDTAASLISSLGLELSLYDPRDLPALASDLLVNHRNALIVGHSNTTPELARLLCQCEVSDMDDSEYERLIIVTVSDTETTVDTLTQTTLFLPWGQESHSPGS